MVAVCSVVLTSFVIESRFPDEDAGEIPMAYIVRKPDSTISATEIMDIIAKQAGFHTSPSSFLVLTIKNKLHSTKQKTSLHFLTFFSYIHAGFDNYMFCLLNLICKYDCPMEPLYVCSTSEVISFAGGTV